MRARAPLRGVPGRAGFTLVEMLVVLAIVGILAAILLPAFNRAREGAQRASCASNLKQIGLGLRLYTQDHQGFYPILGNGGQHRCSLWIDRVLPYVKSEAVFECPSAEDGQFRAGCPSAEASEGGAQGSTASITGSYDLNVPNSSFVLGVNGGHATSYPRQAINDTRYRRPSSTILALDGDGLFVNPGTQEPLAQTPEDLIRYGVDARHSNGANAAFADGHVKWLPLDAMLKHSLWTLAGPE